MLEIDRELDLLVSLSSTLKFVINVSMCIVLWILLTCKTRPRHIPHTNTEENAWLLCSPVLFHPKLDMAYIYIYIPMMSLTSIASNDAQKRMYIIKDRFYFDITLEL